MTLFYPCHNNIKNKNNKNPHQNLSEGGVLEVWNLTINYSWAFGWVSGVKSPRDPWHKKNKNKNKGFTLTGVWHWRPSLVLDSNATSLCTRAQFYFFLWERVQNLSTMSELIINSQTPFPEEEFGPFQDKYVISKLANGLQICLFCYTNF